VQRKKISFKASEKKTRLKDMKNTEETAGLDPKAQGKVVNNGAGAKAEGNRSISKTTNTKNETIA